MRKDFALRRGNLASQNWDFDLDAWDGWLNLYIWLFQPRDYQKTLSFVHLEEESIASYVVEWLSVRKESWKRNTTNLFTSTNIFLSWVFVEKVWYDPETFFFSSASNSSISTPLSWVSLCASWLKTPMQLSEWLPLFGCSFFLYPNYLAWLCIFWWLIDWLIYVFNFLASTNLHRVTLQIPRVITNLIPFTLEYVFVHFYR